MSETPSFTEQVIANQLPDGYWLEAFPFTTDDSPPHLVGYGLGTSEAASKIKLYWNPYSKDPRANGNSQSAGTWNATEIQSLDFPVALTYADLTGDGSNDIIICDRYGPTMDNLWDAETNNGGRVQWLRNPGRLEMENAPDPSVVHWEAKPIGNSTGMHRLKAGHFTTKEFTQIMAIPIIPKSSDLTSPAPVIIYTPVYNGSSKAQGPSEWKEEIVQFDQDAQFRLIHDIKVVHSEDGGLDQAVVAGREGITLFWYDSDEGWKHNVIGTGLDPTEGNPYWGTGSVDIGRVGDDPVGYIATVEAFHGDTVSVYVKKMADMKGPTSLQHSELWTRFVVKSFGPLNSHHTGTLHHVVCGNFHGTGTDSFVIACMGDPTDDQNNIGMYMFNPRDLSTAQFDDYHISTESAGRIALADFRGVGTLDIASIIYYVPGYLTPPGERSIRILYPASKHSPFDVGQFKVSRLINELFIRVPRPAVADASSSMGMPMIEVAGKRIWICVLPPNGSVKFDSRDGVKVLFGQIIMETSEGPVTRGISPIPKIAETTMVLSSDGTITAGTAGAVCVRIQYLADTFQGPYNAMSQLPIKNVFPATLPPDVVGLPFPFNKVEDLSWASSGLWDGFEFYNMTGFHVFYDDDAMENVAHIQLWTLGIGETARFHNHSDKSFCEIHMCISNGGGNGGMRYFSDSYTDSIDTDKELTKEYVEDNSTLIPVLSMEEHGPLWKIQDVPGVEARPQIRPNGTVDYPWHAWLASKFGDYELPMDPLGPDEQKYDVWLAFEYPSTAFQGPLTEPAGSKVETRKPARC